jgi:hypothetical protein
MISFIKAKIWSGAGWLLTLCVILSVVILAYFLLHSHFTGDDHKKLDTTQLANIDNIFSENPDPVTATVKATPTDSVKVQRAKRDKLLCAFLQNEYDGKLDTGHWNQLNTVLLGMNNKDAKLYLTNQEIIVHDYFWFTGSLTYIEVILWALVGVLVSLIYYVSLANSQQAKDADEQNGDIGPFDSSEISGQVAKMFYAPICALVLVLGYNLLNADNKMTDISIGKGLLLFSFICGFFSGRVMKFIDRLKDLVLPVSSSSGTGATGKTGGTDTPTAATTADITTSLQLTPALAQSADGPDITEGGFNTAIVTLQPTAGGAPITLETPAEDQGANFTAKQVPFGKYTLQAAMAYKNATTVINLSASEDVDVSATNSSFQVQLDKTAVSG